MGNVGKLLKIVFVILLLVTFGEFVYYVFFNFNNFFNKNKISGNPSVSNTENSIVSSINQGRDITSNEVMPMVASVNSVTCQVINNYDLSKLSKNQKLNLVFEQTGLIKDLVKNYKSPYTGKTCGVKFSLVDSEGNKLQDYNYCLNKDDGTKFYALNQNNEKILSDMSVLKEGSNIQYTISEDVGTFSKGQSDVNGKGEILILK